MGEKEGQWERREGRTAGEKGVRGERRKENEFGKGTATHGMEMAFGWKPNITNELLGAHTIHPDSGQCCTTH